MMLDEDTICEITHDVIAIFGQEAHPIWDMETAPGVSSIVAINGPQSAIVEIQMPWNTANEFAKLMEDVSEPSPSFAHDVAGEIANMIGGNVKGLLAGPSHLSIPSVNPNAAHWTSIPASPDMQKTVGFQCELGKFFVTVTLTKH